MKHFMKKFDVFTDNNYNIRIKWIRPWHDAQVTARARAATRTNQDKGGLGGQ